MNESVAFQTFGNLPSMYVSGQTSAVNSTITVVHIKLNMELFCILLIHHILLNVQTIKM